MRFSYGFLCAFAAFPLICHGYGWDGVNPEVEVVKHVRYPQDSNGDGQELVHRELGCDVQMTIKFNINVPTTFTVATSDVSNGSFDIEGCWTDWIKTSSNINCQLKSASDGGYVYIRNNGQGSPCDGAIGSFTAFPEASFSAVTGLDSITFKWDDSGGPHAATTNFELDFNTGASVTGYSFGQKYATAQDLDSNSKGTLTFTIEEVVTPAPIVAPNFTSYGGVWNFIASGSQTYTESATITYQKTQTNQYANQFLQGLTVTDEITFSAFEGVALQKNRLTIAGKTEFTETVTKTVSTMTGESYTTTCSSITCDGRLYQWIVYGTTEDRQYSTVSNCYFACVPNSEPLSPQCPNGFCGTTDCQCCNALWIANNTDPGDNHLCSDKNTVVQGAQTATSTTSWAFSAFSAFSVYLVLFHGAYHVIATSF